MWKPGNLVTLNGVVYRVKRSDSWNVCRECALNCGPICTWPFRLKQYPMPDNCYLERVSP